MNTKIKSQREGQIRDEQGRQNDEPVAQHLTQPFNDLGRFRSGFGVLSSDPSDSNDRESTSPDDDEGHEQDERKFVLNGVLQR